MRRHHRTRMTVAGWGWLGTCLSAALLVALAFNGPGNKDKDKPPVGAAPSAPTVTPRPQYQGWVDPDVLRQAGGVRAPMYWENPDGTLDPVTTGDMRSLRQQFEHTRRCLERPYKIEMRTSR